MVKNISKNKGFTLAEILIALVILSVFFMAAAKILTMKPKKHYATSIHGYYECYYDNETLKYHSVYEAYDPNPKNADNNNYCSFTPSKNVAYYNIIIIYPNTTGGVDDGGAYTDIQPAINNELKIYPETSTIRNAKGDSVSFSRDDNSPDFSDSDLQVYLNITIPKCKVLDVVKQAKHKGAIIINW